MDPDQFLLIQEGASLCLGHGKQSLAAFRGHEVCAPCGDSEEQGDQDGDDDHPAAPVMTSGSAAG